MYSIEEVKKANENYKKECAKLNKMFEELRKINDNLDLDEVEEKLSYAEVRELYNLLLGRFNDSRKCGFLEKILKDKKIEEHPEINGVHYYPIINEIDFLYEEEKVELDKLIKDAYKNKNEMKKLNSLSKRVTDFLVSKSILEKNYIFHCNCHGFDCFDEIISEKKLNKLKDYWHKEDEGVNTPEEDSEMNYGSFEVGCWNDCNISISSMEDFNKNLRKTEFIVKMEPDTSLDRL